MKNMLCAASAFLALIVLACSSDGDSGCPKIKEAVASITTPVRIDVMFAPNSSADSYQIEYGLAGFTRGTGSIIVTSDDYVEIENLTPSTLYDIYIRSICSETEMSRPFKLGSVSTEPSQCTYDTSLVIVSMSDDTAFLNFDFPFTPQAYQVQYGPVGFALGSGQMATSDDGHLYVSGLTIGQTYDFYARAQCGNDEWAPYKKFVYTHN